MKLSDKTLQKYLAEVDTLGKISAVLHWDQETGLPEKAASERGDQLALIAKLYHTKTTDATYKKMVSSFSPQTPEEIRLQFLLKRQLSKDTSLSTEFVTKMTKATATANTAWQKARKANDFSVFAPALKKLVTLAREQAKYYGYTEHPYDALLDIYEPDLTTKKLQPYLDEMKATLPGIIQKVRKSGRFNTAAPAKEYPIDLQKQFTRQVTTDFGFDDTRGAERESIHPFTITMGNHDIRITSHYYQHHPMGIFSTFHEAGHALYEQNINPDYKETPLGDAVSLSVHESQSRLWENIIGRSHGFWQHYFPYLKELFPNQLKDSDADGFYEIVNKVAYSPIRVEADELTYNLHIILRTEIEIGLIEGSIEVEELPTIWNKKMKQYLDITPKDDLTGVLQDVHWSHMLFGYFPTYMLGNILSGQLYATATKQLPELEKQISNAEFKPLLTWLKNNIYTHGSLYPADELIKRVTGESLDSSYYLDYLTHKYLS